VRIVRRVVPWALLSLVAVAGVVGAVAGIANQPTVQSIQPKLSEIAAAVRATGTARFTNSSVATSRNPLLRSASIGSGAVDFRASSVTTTGQDTSTGISQDGTAPSQHAAQTMLNDQIWVGRTVYTRLGITGQHFAIPWIKGQAPSGSFGGLGVLDEVDPIGFLDNAMGIRDTKVELIRSEVLGGVATMRYQVVLPACSARPNARGPRGVLGAIDLWLDREGRLVQVRDVRQTTETTGSLAGHSTITSTIRLLDFGVPVTISAPKTVLPPGQGAVAFLSLSVKGCPN